jgi:hypothetical protein
VIEQAAGAKRALAIEALKPFSLFEGIVAPLEVDALPLNLFFNALVRSDDPADL